MAAVWQIQSLVLGAILVMGPNGLQKETPHLLCVGLQRAEKQPCPQQREESIIRMAEVLHYLPALGPAPLAVDGLQVRELSADGAPPSGEPTYPAQCCFQTRLGCFPSRVQK